MNNIEFEERLFEMRMAAYRHPKIDIINVGFRPVSGKVADFCVIENNGRYHFFYIERRLQEGTPFYPGNEIYFGHASTEDFFNWEVHDPVMLIRPGTWEEAHVWAPFVFRYGGLFVMAYTGVNRYISQNIGLAFSKDLFEWERWDGNPISPCKDKDWAFWREDRISSCRDPHVFEHNGRIWMCYTANTRSGASCIALTSTDDLKHWEDHGPILIGPADGYEPRLEGGHPQGSLESSNLLVRNDRWFLLVNAAIRGTPIRCWVFESNSIDSFNFSEGREFWHGGGGVEIVKEKGSRALLASFASGTIRFGEVDWAAEHPTARFVTEEQLREWQK
ncbi:MAG: hypothetical protein QHH26_03140 [Armatimonadota bacterium]|nr:hypothetical protein [Armatimonadota bacterium]